MVFYCLNMYSDIYMNEQFIYNIYKLTSTRTVIQVTECELVTFLPPTTKLMNMGLRLDHANIFIM